MNTYKNHGFTIIELVLFIAISTLMLVIGFSAISGRTQDVQFTDSVRTLESQLRRNMSNVGFGLNLRGDIDCTISSGDLAFPAGDGSPEHPTPGKNKNCVANGVILSFSAASEEEFRVGAVASLDDESVNTEDAPLDILNAKLSNNHTAVVPGTVQSVDFNWQARFIGAVVDDGSSLSPWTGIQFLRLRSIKSSTEYLFVRTNFASNEPLDSFAGTQISDDTEYVMCMEGENGRRASISVGSDALFQANFEDDRCSVL